MKANARLVALLATATIVESLTTLPSCATTCESTYTGTSTDSECSMFDYKCLCTNTIWLSSSICCLNEHCSESDRQQASSYARTLCSQVGYIIPSGLACSTTAASSSSTSVSTSVAAATSVLSSTAGGSKTSGSADASSSSSSSSSGSTSGSDSGSGSKESSSSNSQSSSNSGSTDSGTLKIGLGVGLGLGIPLVAIVAGLLGFFLRRKRDRPAAASSGPGTEQPPVSQAPPPQNYPPTAYTPQGHPPPSYHPPQGYPPQGYPPQAAFVDPLKNVPPSVSPVSNVNTTPSQHEMMGNVPPPMHELAPESRMHNELPVSHPHMELPATPLPPQNAVPANYPHA